MRTLVELFGPLEYFRSFRVPPPEEANGFPYAPHPSLKVESNKAEDALTWGSWSRPLCCCFSLITLAEIKWAQRNDAVSAVHVRPLVSFYLNPVLMCPTDSRSISKLGRHLGP